MELFGDVAEQYAEFASYAEGESACFVDWGRRAAADPAVLEWLARLPRIKQQPNLVFAAARWHGAPAPGPYAGLRAALLDDDGAIVRTIEARSTQTNEAGRLATLVPVLAQIEVEAGEPLALVEAGASAGLCLYPDAYCYRWWTDHGEVSVGSGPDLGCRVTGPAPLPERPPAVAARFGVDLNPLDVTDADAMAWLEMLVWPEQDTRRQRLVAAVDVARRDPPRLTRGDLLEELPGLVRDAGRHGPVVVFHSAVVAYLDPPRRERFHRLMSDLVAARACRWVSNEGPDVLPAVTATAPEMTPGRPAFVLGMDGRAVALAHGHGAWLTWLG